MQSLEPKTDAGAPGNHRDRLLERVLAGDPQAERALYDAHVDRLYHLTLRMTADEDLAREYTQQAFIRAFRRLETFRGESSFTTWLHRLTVNVVLTGHRKNRRSNEVEQEWTPSFPPAVYPGQGDPLLRQRIHDALDSLPELYRVVVEMYHIHGFSHDEIASALNIPSGTSKARLSRARARLRTLLAECALDYATC